MQQPDAPPRDDRTAAQVEATIASPSPLVRHGVDILDPATLEETDDDALPIDWEAGGQVRWGYRPGGAEASATDRTEVRRSATLPLAGLVDEAVLLGRLFRIWTDLTGPDGVVDRFHLGTFTSSLPRWDDDGTVVRATLNLLPREHLWRTRTIAEPQVVAATDDVFDVIRTDLATVFGVTDDRLPTVAASLGQAMVFDQDTGYLDKWTRLCHGVGYDQLTTDVDGYPTTRSLELLAATGPEWTYGPGDGRIVVAGSVDPLDLELPNVVRFAARRGPSLGNTEGNGYRTWRNQSTGPASIDARGFQVFRLVHVDAANQADLDAFAAAEAQRYLAGGGTRFTGQVGLNPLHDDRDVVRIRRPRLDIDEQVGLVTGWTYPVRRIRGPADALMDITIEPRVEVA